MAYSQSAGAGYDDELRILVATDNHIGYAERDPVRGDDSLRTFEEVLQLAHEHDADMVLLGGDLFHENKPSNRIMHRTVELLRAYCLGNRPCALRVVSDQAVNFQSRFPLANFLDPNINVGMPVFSIHGNHDDPVGDGNLAALDLLSTAGLVNYFGRARQVDDIKVSPILLLKGNVKLALYGLGNIRDERLHRSFLQNNVTFLRPIEGENDEQEDSAWFNLLVFHQTRVPHSRTSYIPEKFLPGFLDLIIWGHEHDCRVTPEFNSETGFAVSQPGSTVATSLSEGEAIPKHAALLRIREDGQYCYQKLKLKTVRPMVIKELELSKIENLSPTDLPKLYSVITQAIEFAIAEFKDSNMLPLLKLKVENTGFPTISKQRLAKVLVNQVANPNDAVMFYQKRRKQNQPDYLTSQDDENNAKNKGNGNDEEEEEEDVEAGLRVEKLVKSELKSKPFAVLNELEMADVLQISVEKREPKALSDCILRTLERTTKSFKNMVIGFDEESIDIAIQAIKREHTTTYTKTIHDDPTAQEETKPPVPTPKPAKRATQRQTKSQTTRKQPAKTTRAKQKPYYEQEEVEEEEDEEMLFSPDSVSSSASARRKTYHSEIIDDDDEEQEEDEEESQGTEDETDEYDLFAKPSASSRAKRPAMATRTRAARPSVVKKQEDMSPTLTAKASEKKRLPSVFTNTRKRQQKQ